MKPRILIVDDDPLFLETYSQILGEEGYSLSTATSRDQALAKLSEHEGWDIVILDQKLQGSGGPDSGLDMISEARDRSPGARVIMVTAYATDDAVRRAFQLGAYDYFEKTPLLAALLRAKVSAAWQAGREARMAAQAASAREDEIVSTWNDVRSAVDPHAKGAALENLFALILQSVPGFRRLEVRRRNEIEELDIVVANESEDSGWQKESPYILVECKNWSSSVGRPELDIFRAKMSRRHGRCRLGFFVAPSGFTAAFDTAKHSDTASDILVVAIGPEQLEKLVSATDRSEHLKRLVQAAIVQANGN